MKYVKLILKTVNEEQSEICMALFTEWPVLGMEQKENGLEVYLNEADWNEQEILEPVTPFIQSYAWESMDDLNWNQQWESSFEPVYLGNEILIRASFHTPQPQYRYQIVITPKMSFGTGHHQTTRLMLQFIHTLNMENKRVLDFGCGTGILSIFARMKGASFVLGTDHDEWCIQNARENVVLNDLDGIEITARALNDVEGPFDVVLANINLNVLKDHVRQLYTLLNPGGILILSGILCSDREALSRVYSEAGFHLRAAQSEGDWLAMQWERS